MLCHNEKYLKEIKRISHPQMNQIKICPHQTAFRSNRLKNRQVKIRQQALADQENFGTQRMNAIQQIKRQLKKKDKSQRNKAKYPFLIFPKITLNKIVIYFLILYIIIKNMSSKDSFFNQYGKPFLVGSLSGSVASSVIQPIDTTKVVIQARREAAGKGTAVTNPFVVAKEIVSQNGVMGLYKGLDSAILRQFIYCGIRLGLYKSLEDGVKLKQKRNLTFAEKVQYSLLSGGIGSAIANPTDVALIRFQSDNNLPPAERRNYKNVFHALSTIAKDEGIAGLWTGAIPTIARASVLNCAHLVAYNQAKEELQHLLGEKTETMSIRLFSSAVSGVATAFLSLPFDNIKTKVMKQKKGPDGVLPYSGLIDCFRKSIARQGLFGLWVGLPTYYARIAPHAMITVLLQDFFHDLLSAYDKRA